MKCGCKVLAVFWLLQPLPGMAAEQAMGRLFFRPEQRAQMDVARQQEPGVKIAADSRENESPAVNITLNGVVSRSDGRATVWLNNRPESGSQLGRGITLQSKLRQVNIQARDGRASVPLTVGQRLDIASGRVEEAYRRAPLPPPAERHQALPFKALSRPADTRDATSTPDAADVQGGMPSP